MRSQFIKCILIMSFAFFAIESRAADAVVSLDAVNIGKKGSIYFYWGWNRGFYTKSDISFKGDDYNFTLRNVAARDRQTRFGLTPYFDPGLITIPQTNFRLGYFISDSYDISFGIDHMKYVMNSGQSLKIDGEISRGGPFDKTYKNEKIAVTPDFLKFEHTDGLNYLNLEINRNDTWLNLKDHGYWDIEFNSVIGIGVGALYPKTNVTFMGEKRHDDFHLSGYGLSGKVGTNVVFYDHILLQSEAKAGFIHMPDIRTTHSGKDSAAQKFGFLQVNILVGSIFKL